MKAFIVDDEENNIEVLKVLIARYCPEVNVLGSANNISDAFLGVNALQPNILFLDIDLAPFTGFELLKKFDEYFFEVIFVTAHSHYAIEAIKFSALDYLRKPVNIDELKNAVKKAERKLSDSSNIGEAYKQIIDKIGKTTRLVINSHKETFVIELDDILYLKSDNSYTHIYTKKSNPILSSKSIKEYEEVLLGREFFRVHKSYIVNINNVSSVSKSDFEMIILDNGNQIPLAVRRREEFFRMLQLK